MSKPDYIVYARNKERDYFHRIGAAWNQNGAKGPYISITLDALPVDFNGRLTIHPYHPEDQDYEPPTGSPRSKPKDKTPKKPALSRRDGTGPGGRGKSSSRAGKLDDEIPF